jgi:hypothetical protein
LLAKGADSHNDAAAAVTMIGAQPLPPWWYSVTLPSAFTIPLLCSGTHTHDAASAYVPISSHIPASWMHPSQLLMTTDACIACYLCKLAQAAAAGFKQLMALTTALTRQSSFDVVQSPSTHWFSPSVWPAGQYTQQQCWSAIRQRHPLQAVLVY